jgi:phosphoglycolate phosphatase
MKLRTLDRYNDIVIQMHDNPDADAVGSGFALYKYFRWKGKDVRLIYGGKFKITKRNILMMIDELDIPVEYVKELDYKPELLLTVDCQYGEGNVFKFEAENIAMIDHHNTGRSSDAMCEIRSHIVSCSTICFDMLKNEGYNVNADVNLATALYYGLFMDSNELAEIRHPLDHDMIEELKINRPLISKFKHSNFTLQELETAGIALVRYSYDEKKRLSIIKANPCDPNILGLIGDLVVQVDSIDVNIIFNECPGGYKLSIRSCVAEVAANELAEYLTEGIGNGGGHLDKSGGFINKNKFDELYGAQGIESYFFSRVDDYFDSYDIFYADEGLDDYSKFKPHIKLPYTYGYVKTAEMFEPGTECRVRTYEGDVYVTAKEDIYLMIGYFGEVYPIERETFERNYTASNKPYEWEFEYEPLVMNMSDNKMHGILSFAKKCVSDAGGVVMAKQLRKPAKVFTKWDYEKYMYGVAGDYICYPADDENDIYLVKKEVFENTYVRGDEA